MKKVVRVFLKSFLLLILVFMAIIACFQVATPVYNFGTPKPFSGEKLYNPYRNFEPSETFKANFHAHTIWDVNGDYTTKEFIDAYRDKGYDIIGIADHQNINPGGYTPTYEHGVNASNFHLLMLGAKQEVSWFDYPVMLSPLNQMQHSLNKFAPQTKVVVLNHPDRIRYIKADKIFSRLQGYSLTEMNPPHNPTPWDIALSSGIYSNLIANDDAHSITARNSWFQKCYTVVGSSSIEPDAVLDALMDGSAYGVVIGNQQNQSPEPHKNLPRIVAVGTLHGDSVVSVTVDRPADSIRFIGQGGRVVGRTVGDSVATYRITPEDTYVRVVCHFEPEIEIWTNPFVRCESALRPKTLVEKPEMSWPKTLLSVAVNLIGLMALIFLIYKVWRKL